MHPAHVCESLHVFRPPHHQIGDGGEDDFRLGFGPRVSDRLVRQVHDSRQFATASFGTLIIFTDAGAPTDEVTP